MNLVNWNDSRLDGFAADFQILDTKVDHLVVDVASNNHRLDDIEDDQRRSASSVQFKVMIFATILSNPLTAGVVFLLTKGR